MRLIIYFLQGKEKEKSRIYKQMGKEGEITINSALPEMQWKTGHGPAHSQE